MSCLRNLFKRNEHSGGTFRPDQPPAEPYPALNPYQTTITSNQKTHKDFPPLPPAAPPKPQYPQFGPLPSSDSDDGDLPPPPAWHTLHLTSPTSNAPSDLADAAWEFTDTHALSVASHFTADALDSIRRGAIGLSPPPPTFQGTITSQLGATSIINVSSSLRCRDACLISALPLYAAGYHHPINHNWKPRSAYFEVFAEQMPRESALAIGFVAVPYPGFRLPGWNRGSLGVHGDDGHRYVNDSFGGKEFVAPFREGEKVGIGMTWAESGVEVWFTRGGVREGGWRLDEPRDAEEENDPMVGLDGACDVYAAVGIWGGGVKAQIRFFPEGNM